MAATSNLSLGNVSPEPLNSLSFLGMWKSSYTHLPNQLKNVLTALTMGRTPFLSFTHVPSGGPANMPGLWQAGGQPLLVLSNRSNRGTAEVRRQLSTPGEISASQGDLWQCQDIFDYHNQADATSTQWAEARDAAEPPLMHRAKKYIQHKMSVVPGLRNPGLRSTKCKYTECQFGYPPDQDLRFPVPQEALSILVSPDPRALVL